MYAQSQCVCSLTSPAVWGWGTSVGVLVGVLQRSHPTASGAAMAWAGIWAGSWAQQCRGEGSWTSGLFGQQDGSAVPWPLQLSRLPEQAAQSSCKLRPNTDRGLKSRLAAGVSCGMPCQAALITDVHRHLTLAAGAGAPARRRHWSLSIKEGGSSSRACYVAQALLSAS